jgi:hypothetical protein
MNWLTSLFSSGASVVIDSVGKAIDNLVTSDEEKLKLKNELASEMNKFTLDMESKSNEFEQEITKRWTSDNQHWVTRLVRPMSYGWIIFIFSAVVLADGNIGSFSVKESFIPVLETLMITMTVSYFGARSIDKYNSKSKNS